MTLFVPKRWLCAVGVPATAAHSGEGENNSELTFLCSDYDHAF